eukprot:12551816-Heterocapsa_arctica.AAC.1
MYKEGVLFFTRGSYAVRPWSSPGAFLLGAWRTPASLLVRVFSVTYNTVSVWLLWAFAAHGFGAFRWTTHGLRKGAAYNCGI